MKGINTMGRSAATMSFVLVGALTLWCQAPTKPYAQMLVNETLLRRPDLSGLSMTVADPATNESRVIAGNAAAMIGSKAGEDDLKVLAGRGPATTPDSANHRCRALVPLHDVSGTTIGTLRSEFRFDDATDNSKCLPQAEELRDQLASVIPSAQTLFDPFIVASSSGDILAQRLTIETLAKYPDVLVLAFHVTAPGESVNRVVGINQPKFLGRSSDDVDHDVAKTGKTVVQLIPKTHRMEVHMPLRAVDGSLVGTLVTVFLWRQEAEAPELIGRSMKLRDELQPRIPSLVALLAREPQHIH